MKLRGRLGSGKLECIRGSVCVCVGAEHLILWLVGVITHKTLDNITTSDFNNTSTVISVGKILNKDVLLMWP